METSISFKSKINFVNSSDFQRLKKGENIDFRTIVDSFKQADEFYTEGVRTCAGGSLINTKTKQAAGFHLYDNIDRFNFYKDNIIDKIFKLINPDKCLLLGGNRLNCSPFSMEQFAELKEIFGKRVDKITVFEEHAYPYAETDLHYSAKNDIFNIHSMYRPNYDYKEHSILSKDELLQCFKNVVISPEDELIFN